LLKRGNQLLRFLFEKTTMAGMKYICINCGFIYDPAVGDPAGDIPPGTAFEALPDNWTCPICYVSKDQFDPMD
jgi:rubredoxin